MGEFCRSASYASTVASRQQGGVLINWRLASSRLLQPGTGRAPALGGSAALRHCFRADRRLLTVQPDLGVNFQRFIFDISAGYGSSRIRITSRDQRTLNEPTDNQAIQLANPLS